MSRSLPLAAVLLAVCGCAPHVEWRADSNAFFYSLADGRILEYDLEKKSSHELMRVEVGENGDVFPGFDLRPDCERLVVAESRTVGNDTRLVQTTVRIVDLDGKAEKTGTLEWQAVSDVRDEAEPVPTFAEWSPTAKHVLVATQDSIAIWNVETGAFQPYEDLSPVLPLYFGTSPWRPDGRGLLAIGEAQKPTELAFVSTDGSVVRFETGEAFEGADMNKFIPRGRWDGKALVATIGPRRVTIDTEARTVVGEDVAAEPSREHILGEARLRLTYGDKSQLDWIKGERTIPLGKEFAATFTLENGPVVVSPDGKRAVVVRRNDLVVVDETGIVAEIEAAEAKLAPGFKR